MLQGLGKVFPHIIASFLLNPFTPARKCQMALTDFTLTPDYFTRQWGAPQEWKG